MEKIKAKAIPVTKKLYLCLTKILELAEYMPDCRGTFNLSPEWSGSIICLDELGYTEASKDDFIIEGAPKNDPYFLEVDGALLVVARPDNGWFYPCVGNAKGYEFDSYTEPLEHSCAFKMMSHEDENQSREGIYFIKKKGSLETWRQFYYR